MPRGDGGKCGEYGRGGTEVKPRALNETPSKPRTPRDAAKRSSSLVKMRSSSVTMHCVRLQSLRTRASTAPAFALCTRQLAYESMLVNRSTSVLPGKRRTRFSSSLGAQLDAQLGDVETGLSVLAAASGWIECSWYCHQQQSCR